MAVVELYHSLENRKAFQPWSSTGYAASNSPRAFQSRLHSLGTEISCKDPRWRLLGTSIVFSILLSIFTTSPAVFFGSTFVGIYFSVALALDPVELKNYYSVISWAFGRFLPAAFVGLVIYYFWVSYTLRDLTAHFEKTFFGLVLAGQAL